MPKTKAEPKDRPITAKERILVKGIAEGKPKYVAAMEAYNAKSPETAASIASNTLKKVNVQEALAQAFKKHGIDIESATKPIADGLKADKLQVIDGKVIKSADHSIRLSAARTAFNLMGVNSEGGGASVQFINIIQGDTSGYNL